jgi:GWxTD domain-containing protein
MNWMKTIMRMALLLVQVATAQVEVTEGLIGNAASPFDVDAISFMSDSTNASRLDIYVAIPYEQLSFVKKGESFTASYEMTIAITDSSNALVNERLWTREISVPSFEQSVASGASNIEQRIMVLSPGRYRIAVICRDLESRLTRRVYKQLLIPDYRKPGLQLSDIMLIAKLAEKEDGKKTIKPSISANVVDIPAPLHIFFEAYNFSTPDTLHFITTVFNAKNEKLYQADTMLYLGSTRNKLFLRVDHSNLAIGDYKMFVHAYSRNTNPTVNSLANTSRPFLVRWAGLPKSVKDIDIAIEQLRYIAKEHEIEHIKAAATAEEKQKRFFEYWKKKDPNPNTLRNERMEEHYARVEYANKHFKHYIEGWRTDMGMVYIIFGAPSNVERHPFDSDAKPYETWSYYELNYTFTFVDQTGFGDYRLTTPIWDVWQRPRN